MASWFEKFLLLDAATSVVARRASRPSAGSRRRHAPPQTGSLASRGLRRNGRTRCAASRIARAARVEAARRVVLFVLGCGAYTSARSRLAFEGGPRSRRVPLRLGPVLRPRRPASVVDALPDAGDPLVRGRVARRLRRPFRRAADGGPLRRLDRLLGGRRAVLRARAAIAVAAALLLYQGYALMFHELSSEPVFAAAFALWALLVTRAAFAPSTRRFALVASGSHCSRSFARETPC